MSGRFDLDKWLTERNSHPWPFETMFLRELVTAAENFQREQMEAAVESRVSERTKRLREAVKGFLGKHQMDAKLVGFERCGCEACVEFRRALESE